MSDLVEFLRARLAEDEQTAQLAGPARIAWLTYRHADGDLSHTTVGAADDVDGPWVAAGEELPSPASVRVVYEPARVLAEVEAKRRIVAECGPSSIELVDAMGAMVLAYLALPYADHPDYCEEWRP